MKNTQSAPTKPGRLRRRLSTALLVLGLTVGTIATTATPAEAASSVSGCFAPYWAGMTLVAMPVKLQASANPYDPRFPWIDMASATIFGNGNGACVQWYINDPLSAPFSTFGW